MSPQNDLNTYIYYNDLQSAQDVDMLYHTDRAFIKLRD